MFDKLSETKNRAVYLLLSTTSVGQQSYEMSAEGMEMLKAMALANKSEASKRLRMHLLR